MTQIKNKKAKFLNGGAKRKLCLGMAIIGENKVIYLDEPTSGMDPLSRKHIWNLFRLLKKEGKCVVLTTHHLEEAEALADKIAIMSKGKLLILDTANGIKKKFGVGYKIYISDK